MIKWLVLLHAVAFLALILSSLLLEHKVIIGILIVISLFIYIKQAIGSPVIYIKYSAGKAWEIASLENQLHSVEILSSTVLTSFLIIFHYKAQNDQKKSIIIYKDALELGQFRQLLVELKITGLKKE